MWWGAFPPEAVPPTSVIFSTALVLAAMIASAWAIAKGTGAQYALKGTRVGFLIAVIGIISYLAGTSFQSEIIHTLSIAVFYSGCVLYLAGARAFVSALPAGFIMLLTFAPTAYGELGLIYLDSLAWALIVISAALLWDSRNVPQIAPCHICPSYESRGRRFCGSCGRKLGPTTGPSSRRLLGLAVSAVVMAILFIPTFPLVTTGPSVSAVNYGLGGPQLMDNFAPLSGWSTRASTLSVGGVPVSEYTLSNAGTTIEAFVAATQDASVFNETRSTPVSSLTLPSSIAQSMVGYSFQQKGTQYIDLEGSFQVTMVNGSSVQSSLVAINLRENAADFEADHGSSLYSAAESVISWTSTSYLWSGWAVNFYSAYQLVSQAAIACSFACLGVVLFTLARDDELVKSRRLESMRALENPEKAVLEAFGPGSYPVTGVQLREENLKGNYWVPESAVYSSLDELERRGLISTSVTIKNWVPVLQWRRLV